MKEQSEVLLKTCRALERNKINAHIANTPEQARKIALDFLSEGCMIAVGGSVTLRQLGIQQMLEDGPYRYTNRYVKGSFEFDKDLDEKQIRQSYLDAYTADVYFCGVNAITSDGKLLFVDGSGNRVSAIAYGPRKVVIVAGINKIVEDVHAGFERIRTIAAPMNNQRYGRQTPCTKTGRCVDCMHPERGCSDYLIVSYQKQADRIHVILVEQELGF